LCQTIRPAWRKLSKMNAVPLNEYICWSTFCVPSGLIQLLMPDPTGGVPLCAERRIAGPLPRLPMPVVKRSRLRPGISDWSRNGTR
jgi:hypothetical protein